MTARQGSARGRGSAPVLVFDVMDTLLTDPYREAHKAATGRGFAEFESLRPEGVYHAFERGEIGERDPLEVEAAGRVFLNDAARLLDLEESGMFRFWEADDLARLLRRAGFRKVETCLAFGDPPQALVLATQRP